MSVSVNLPLIIKDACILFDLLDLELLPSFYQLQLTVITTPEVLNEIEDEQQMAQVQPYIDDKRLLIDRQGEIAAMVAITDANPGLSLADASVLDAATRLKAAILSSDGSLRRESQRRGIIVRGLLWVLEELYTNRVLALEVVLEKLQLYPEVNKRAPKTETFELINKLKQIKP